ncbi:MAG TPA: hypothetical protein PKU78_06395 [Candidatus Dojkabacteria bacterium]|nr:hypothetical protein [Candidatus Dojkabacteria bacterium]HRO65827.1 hypothetical protein [Candidatus Dojkabacteria bacterium]HRP50752.1 hypothetical protein [Candidatus Dojkabacteria bacterium]
MLPDTLPVEPETKVACSGYAVVNALGGFISSMLGAPKPGEHTVHVIKAGGNVVDSVSTAEKDEYGVVHHVIPGVRPS